MRDPFRLALTIYRQFLTQEQVSYVPKCTLTLHSNTPGAPSCQVPTTVTMGQSLYLCSGSAGFCCWGLGMGRPFPHVKAWGGTAQITTQGHRGTFFRIVFRYLAIAALSFSGLFDYGKITHHEGVVPGQKPPSLCPRWTGF